MKKLWDRYSYAIILIGLSFGSALTIYIASHSFNEKNYENIIVSEGDSLWRIAQQYSSEYKLSDDQFISWVKKHNHIEGDRIYPGEKLVIPVKDNQTDQHEFASAAK